MEKIITQDGSVTFYSDKYQETYKSVTGAEEESVKKFVVPAQVAERAKSGKIAVLDICFGLGYNTAAALDAALAANPRCDITVVGVEIDPETLAKIPEIDAKFRSYSLIKQMIANNLFYSKDNIHIKLFLEDAQTIVAGLKERFDVIFLDPFSPKKCPELWTERFFRDIFARANSSAILTTYSCARSVRDNLKKAGFIVKDGPCVGRRSPSTVAYVE